MSGVDPAARERLVEYLRRVNAEEPEEGAPPRQESRRELLQRLEGEAAEAAAAEIEDAIERRVEERLAERARAAEAAARAAARPRRSQMTALEKSNYINQHGPEQYRALPWE